MPRSTELWTGHTRATAVAIKPRFANENTSAGWQIAGTVKPFYRPVSELPSTARSELAQPFAPDVLSVEFLVPVRGVRVMADAPLAGVRVIPPSAGETKHRIECQWLEKILIGSHVSTINVRASTVDGKSLPTIAIPCRLDVVEDVRLSQTNVNLVQTGHAVSAEEIVEVYSITSKGIFVTRIEQTVKDPHIVVSIRDASTVTVRATGTTTMTPRRHSVIVIIDSAGRRYEIPLQINIS